MKDFFNSITTRLNCDVLVVGAGPAGSGAALTAAKNGAETVIIDKKNAIGTPIECGECLDPSLLDKYNIKLNPKIIRARHDGTIFYINKELKIDNRSLEWKSISVDRRDLDKSFAYEATSAGAKLLVGAELINAEISDDVISTAIVKTERREILIDPKIVIAADGTFSTVGKLQNRRKLDRGEIGCTVSYEMTNLKIKNPNMVQMFFDDLTGNGYGYIIPLSKNSANVGLGRLGIDEFPWEHLEVFLTEHPIVSPQVKDARIIEIKKGETPLTGPKLELLVGNVLYVGDSSAQNLSHVGEGVIPSHVCGMIAGEVAAKASKKGDISVLDQYPKKISEGIGILFKKCEKIRDKAVEVWSSDLPSNKKFMLGGLLISEVISPEDESTINQLTALNTKNDISEVINLSIKKQGREKYIKCTTC